MLFFKNQKINFVNMSASLFKGDYLRVLSPRTQDGLNPIMDGDDRRLWKETHLPLSARRELELQNKYLPDILKKKIEIVSSGGSDLPAKEGKKK
jgi:hypothetical protein